MYLNLTKLVVNCEKLCYLSGRARDLDDFFLHQSRYYRDIEIIKFERERIALKEEQFMRIVHKAETESKSEIRKCQVRYESQIVTRSRDTERRIEDLEDKLVNC